MRLGELLDTQRKERKLSPEQAAATLGISRRQWDRIVKGTATNLRTQTRLRIRTAMGISSDQIDEALCETTQMTA